MKIAIISDIHANLAALEAFPVARVGQTWWLGDLVGYGSRPREVLQWSRENAMVAVRGNHDHAIGYNVEAHCVQALNFLAADTRAFSESFYCVHPILSDPLFKYWTKTSDQWQCEVDSITADVLLVGHTHTPFIRRLGRTLIFNPGCLGQPKAGRPFACYALYEDGNLVLKEYEYPCHKTRDAIHRMPISGESQEALILVLYTGTASPSAALAKDPVDGKGFLQSEEEKDEQET